MTSPLFKTARVLGTTACLVLVLWLNYDTFERVAALPFFQV